MNYKIAIALIFAGFALLEIVLGRFLHREATRLKDVVIEVVSGLTIPILTVPAIFFTVPLIIDAVHPGTADVLADWPWWAMFLTLIIADDLTQYWWHRLSHTFTWLYPLHRAHHSANYISVRIVYRNSIIYYALMPGLWLSAALLYWGFGPVYVFYIIAKMLVIIGAHSSVPWDAPLLRWRWSQPLMWVLERLISTPATHAAHHGRHADDGVTHYKGNYGNFLFLWDVIFGTAKITRRRPEHYGVEKIAPASTFEELVWPFRGTKSAQENSEAVATDIKSG